MKKLIVFLMMISAIGFSQTRTYTNNSTTSTTVDTVTFAGAVGEVTIIFDETASDTLTFWFKASPSATDKIKILGGEYYTIRWQFASVNTVYLQASGSSKKRRIIGNPF